MIVQNYVVLFTMFTLMTLPKNNKLWHCYWAGFPCVDNCWTGIPVGYQSISIFIWWPNVEWFMAQQLIAQPLYLENYNFGCMSSGL
jgi:hypothetical protein